MSLADGRELIATLYQGSIYTKQLLLVPPLLHIQDPIENIILTWPAESTNFVLQENSDGLGTGGWVDVQVTPTVTNGQNQVTLPMSTGSFYRLKQQ